MNKKCILLILTTLALTSCAKTRELYPGDAYNSPIFDENYYVEWDGINNLAISNQVDMPYSNLNLCYDRDNKVVIGTTEIENYTWGGVKETQFGYNNNLSKVEKKFAYGVTSKLFDGRVRCEQQYQKSRVQVDKSGFAMYFPKSLVSAKYLGFACRGGTDFPQGEEFPTSDLKANFVWSFYIHKENGEYDKISYKLNEVPIHTDFDDGGNTTFINFTPSFGDNFDELNGAVAMSFEWSTNDPRLASRNLTDDYTQKEKHHLALMLYEVFIGDSTWY